MRSVYVNDRCVRINMACGILPIRKCLVQIWAEKNGVVCAKTYENLWDRAIELQTRKENEKAVVAQIQEVCDDCRYCGIKKIKQKTR